VGLVARNEQIPGFDHHISTGVCTVFPCTYWARGGCRALAFDFVSLQELNQPVHARGIGRINGDVVPAKTSLGLGAVGFVERSQLVDEAASEPRTGFDGGEAGFYVVVNAFAQTQQRPVGALDQHPGTPAAALLIGHANGAVVHRVGVPVTRIQQVK